MQRLPDTQVHALALALAGARRDLRRLLTSNGHDCEPWPPSSLPDMASATPGGRHVLARYQAAGWALAQTEEPSIHGAPDIRRHRSHRAYDDLIQLCWLRLYAAAERFAPQRGLKFQTYARWYLKSAVDEWKAENAPSRTVPRDMRKKAEKMADDLRKMTGREVSEACDEEIAALLGLSVQRVRSRRAALAVAVPIDESAHLLGASAAPGSTTDKRRTELRDALVAAIGPQGVRELAQVATGHGSAIVRQMWAERVGWQLRVAGAAHIDPDMLMDVILEEGEPRTGPPQATLFAGGR